MTPASNPSLVVVDGESDGGRQNVGVLPFVSEEGEEGLVLLSSRWTLQLMYCKSSPERAGFLHWAEVLFLATSAIPGFPAPRVARPGTSVATLRLVPAG